MYWVYDLKISDKWVKALNRFPSLDIFYDPEYCSIFQEEGEGKAQLFLCEKNNDWMIYPFFLRRINDLSFLQNKLPQSYFDIVSPYGYSGPVVSTPSEPDIFNYFLEQFSNYCMKNNIVTEFIRFHPLLENHCYHWEGYLEIERAKSLIILDLSCSEEEIWAGYKYNNRKNIRKASREGLEILIEEGVDRFPQFFDIYLKTMDRRKAKPFYYFSQSFFHNIHQKMSGRFVYVFALKNGKPVSAELLLFNNKCIHYFLGGTLSEYYYCRPNNFLKHQIILWAKARGIKYFILGGGYEEDDGIFHYKRSFAPDGVKDFFIGKEFIIKRFSHC
ncbi:MAG: GNAT family N-acetyltransferase [Desulfitobacteriaceae bacterium]|nr:GNAT family N-acetyltransferase [Desulfitobacteriaceae bacterium]MDD4752272.1 GNAT family N-acetyltransferase [Desulfitobacteriaceae bacterium]